MEQNMFCFQCEQTAGCTGCTSKAGVCGKTAQTAELQDRLTGALIGLARATEGGIQATEETGKLLIEGLFTTVTNVNFNDNTIQELIDRVHAEKEKVVPGCGSCAEKLQTRGRRRSSSTRTSRTCKRRVCFYSNSSRRSY